MKNHFRIYPFHFSYIVTSLLSNSNKFLCRCFAHLHYFYQDSLFLKEELALLESISRYVTSTNE